jgi:hypothetical protein
MERAPLWKGSVIGIAATCGRSLLLMLLSVTWLLAGCSRGAEQPAPPPAAGGETAAAEAALGTAQTAGPFQVTLATEAPGPKAGETRFQAKVSRGGQPVTGATVGLSLSMPSMKMSGPDVTLKPAGDQYEGAANLGMAGEWEAKVTVSAGRETGSATYHFFAGS